MEGIPSVGKRRLVESFEANRQGSQTLATAYQLLQVDPAAEQPGRDSVQTGIDQAGGQAALQEAAA